MMSSTLRPGSSPPSPGLAALGDLDLQFVGVGEVPDGDAEPARGHLLDGRTPGIPGRARVRYRSGSSPPSPVLLRPAHAIQRHRQGLVGLGRNGAEAHGSRAEALDDLLRRFNFVQRDGRAGDSGLELQAAPAACSWRAPRRWPVPRSAGTRCRRSFRAACCSDAITTGSQPWRSPRLRQWNSPGLGSAASRSRPLPGYPSACRRSDSCSSTSRPTPWRRLAVPAKHRLDDLVGESDGLEDLRALVGLQRGDAHLGHHLEHALGHTLAVSGDHGLVIRDAWSRSSRPFGAGLRQAPRKPGTD